MGSGKKCAVFHFQKRDKLEVVGGKYGKISVLLISMPLMIVAIVCILFADRIDTVVKGDKKVKKVYLGINIQI